MATNRKKQEEESNLKTLREIVGLAHNKHCFDCNQRGPTYVNMTIGSFICTSCSGLLRGLNPPHRVKSISMTSFSADEMELIKCRGNEYCRRVWLGLYDRKVPCEIDWKDEGRMKDFMSQRYEKKRWYAHPASGLPEECRRLNTSKPTTTMTTTTTHTRTIASIANSTHRPNSEPSHPFNSPSNKLKQQLQQRQQPQQTQQQLPSQQSTQQQQPTQLQQQQPHNKSSFDILNDFGQDFFTPLQANKSLTQSQPDSQGFADFSSFNAFSQPDQNTFFSSQQFQQPAQNLQQSSQLFNQQQQQHQSISSQNVYNTSSSILLPHSSQQPPQPQQQQQPQQQLNSDKYSALVGLNDGRTTVPTTFSAEPSMVDWDGKKPWMTSSYSSSHHHSHQQPISLHSTISSTMQQPPPPSYNTLSFNNVPNQFGALSISSTTPHFLPQQAIQQQQQALNYPPFYQQANGGVLPASFGVYQNNNQFQPAPSMLPRLSNPNPSNTHHWGGANMWGGVPTSSHNPFMTPTTIQAPSQPSGATGGTLITSQLNGSVSGVKNPTNPFL